MGAGDVGIDATFGPALEATGRTAMKEFVKDDRALVVVRHFQRKAEEPTNLSVWTDLSR